MIWSVIGYNSATNPQQIARVEFGRDTACLQTERYTFSFAIRILCRSVVHLSTIEKKHSPPVVSLINQISLISPAAPYNKHATPPSSVICRHGGSKILYTYRKLASTTTEATGRGRVARESKFGDPTRPMDHPWWIKSRKAFKFVSCNKQL